MSMSLNLPLVGLGASASTYYPDVAKRLSCEVISPKFAEVANAIGAVVGRVIVRETASVTAPSEGLYRVHYETGPVDYAVEQDALDDLEKMLREKALFGAKEMGAKDIQVHVSREIHRANAENKDFFVEATLTVEASGRPRIA